jgi:glutathione S-transferase
MDGAPVLWHLKVSNFNEKARWALDYKRVAHVRRAVHPGTHRAIARRLSGGSTFPVLVLDGAAIGDSTEIIAALERRVPDPPLYPVDATSRRRALALEDFFDEELGPYVRLLALHHVLADPELFLDMFAPDLPSVRRFVARRSFPAWRRLVVAEFGIDAPRVERAFRKLRAAGERLRSELGPSGYLCGDGFTVADLTLAALAAPVVAPEQFPYPQPQRGHRLLAPVRAALAESGIADFTLRMYARHRYSARSIRNAKQPGAAKWAWRNATSGPSSSPARSASSSPATTSASRSIASAS